MKGRHTKTEFKKGNKVNLGRKQPKREKSYRWKGGKIKHNNRWFIYKPEHPNTYKGSYIYQSRLVAEKILGRYLTKIEIIHHINENTFDDRPENLYLFENQGKHCSYHMLKNKPKLLSNLIL